MRYTEENVHGLLPVYKPSGMVSKDVSRIVSKRFGRIKMGHVGTLDPMAEGVLPVLLGRSTKLQDYLLQSEKTYTFDLKLGECTDTMDRTGVKVKSLDLPAFDLRSERSKDAFSNLLDEVFSHFSGPQVQVPPLYSAVKLKGKPLYEYARAGRGDEVDLTSLSRSVEIYGLELLGISMDPAGRPESLAIRARCSKGTYVRVLGENIASALGSCGHLTSLLRETTAGVSLNECLSLEKIENTDRLDTLLISHDAIRLPLERVMLSANQIRDVECGRRFEIDVEQLVNSGVPCESERVSPSDLLGKLVHLKSPASSGDGEKSLAIGKVCGGEKPEVSNLMIKIVRGLQ